MREVEVEGGKEGRGEEFPKGKINKANSQEFYLSENVARNKKI